MTNEIIRVNQRVPNDFANTLRALAAQVMNGGNRGRTEASARLNAVLMSAREQGWSVAALAEPLGVSHQAVSARVKRGRVRNDTPPVPLPPRRPAPMPTPKRRLLVKPEVAERLREMHAIAATVNGGTPDDDPARAVSVEFTAALASLVEQGVTVYRLAKALGVTHGAIYSRLARHGYREPMPSQAHVTYLGRQTRGRSTKQQAQTSETAPATTGAVHYPKGDHS